MLNIIFNKDNLIVFSFVFFIQILGLNFLLLFFENFFKKNNLFLNLSYSWFFGNAIFSFLIFFLFVFKKFNVLSLNIFFGLLFLTSILFIFLFLKERKEIKLKKLNLVYFVFALIFFTPLMIESLTSFLISWDALAIWFLKAKALYFDQNILPFLKSENFYYSSQAYPLGIPLIINIYYRLINKVNDQAIQFYFVWFFINMSFLFFGLLINFFEKSFSKFILFLLTLTLMISSAFIIYSHNGYVDFQLGYIFLVIFSLVYFFIAKKENRFLYPKLILLGLGYSLMIKNEALPFSLISVFILLVIFGLNFGILNFVQKYFLYFLSFLPFLYWEFYRRANFIPSFLEGNLVPKKENLPRLKMIFNYFFLEYFNTDKYGLNLIIALFLIIFFGTILFYKGKIKKILPLFLILFFQIISYFYIFFITPFPYIVQLESSLERIFLQFIPLIYFLAIVFVFEGIKD